MNLGSYILWWCTSRCFSLLVYIPMSKHLHLIACPVNEFFRNLKPWAQIYPWTWRTKRWRSSGSVDRGVHQKAASTSTPARCGRCQESCPANISGKKLSPLLHTNLKHHRGAGRGVAPGQGRERQGAAAAGPACMVPPPGAVETSSPASSAVLSRSRDLGLYDLLCLQEQYWSRTSTSRRSSTCAATWCSWKAASPNRRGRVQEHGGQRQPVRRERPGAGDLRKRGADHRPEPRGRDPYWPGCAGSLDARNQKVTTAFVSLMNAAGVSFAVLGNERSAAAKRPGASERISLPELSGREHRHARRLRGQKIVTQCPHCFNTSSTSTPTRRRVRGVTPHPVLSELVDSGRLKLGQQANDGRQNASGSLPRFRYLGRYTASTNSPGTLRAAGVDLVELPRRRAKAFCARRRPYVAGRRRGRAHQQPQGR
jgi:Fe-S oxidoreductase